MPPPPTKSPGSRALACHWQSVWWRTGPREDRFGVLRTSSGFPGWVLPFAYPCRAGFGSGRSERPVGSLTRVQPSAPPRLTPPGRPRPRQGWGTLTPPPRRTWGPSPESGRYGAARSGHIAGWGAVGARASVAYRRVAGPFAAVSDLGRVPGFSHALVARLGPLLTIR